MPDRAATAVRDDAGDDSFRGCAMLENNGTLEDAQESELALLCDDAAISPEKSVLDMGCGWSAALRYLVERRGVRNACGLARSRRHYETIVALRLPGVDVRSGDYRGFAPPSRFDAVISIETLEHIAMPDDEQRGERIAVYRDYFRRVHEWTAPGARLALQTVLTAGSPRDPLELRALCGGKPARLEDIFRASQLCWEIAAARSRRQHRVTALRERRRRLWANRERLAGDADDARHRAYEQYLISREKAFLESDLTLMQFSLRRLD